MITDLFINLFRKDPTVKRHLLKTVSWRIIGSIDTAVLGAIVTGKIDLGVKIGGFELITKMLLYFVHERVWHKIRFGVPTRINKAEKVQRENADKLFLQTSKVTRQQREKLNEHQAFTIWLTGLSASGKSTIANELDSWFYKHGYRSYVIDGDNTRLGINSDLSFSAEDRSENIRRVAEICKLFNDSGVIAVASFISPFRQDRLLANEIIGSNSFVETFVDASLETCKARDKKGLYALAESGKLKNFTGISSPYEKPLSPDIHIYSDSQSIQHSIDNILEFLLTNKKIAVRIESTTN